MKKFKLKILPFLLSISFSISSLFSFNIVSFCADVEWSFSDKFSWYMEHFLQVVGDVTGVIFTGQPTDFNSDFMEMIKGVGILEENGVTFEEWCLQNSGLADYVGPPPSKPSKHSNSSHYSVPMSISPEMQTYMHEFVQNKMDSYGYSLGYTLNITDYFESFKNGQLFVNLRLFLNEYQNDYYIFSNISGLFNTLSYFDFCLIPKDKYCFVLSNIINSGTDSAYNTRFINSNSWRFVSDDTLRNVRDSGVRVFRYEDSKGFYEQELNYLFSVPTPYLGDDKIFSTWNYNFALTNARNDIVPIYNSLNAFKSKEVGIQPYYITDSYNSSNTVSGSYNTTTDNIQTTITGGDITNYINNYYGNPNNNVDGQPQYPSGDIVYNYINNYTYNYPSDSDNDNNGGGSSSGGGSSGGSDSDSGWDFSWLGKLGEILGNLISGLGHLITGILDAIVDLFTTLTEDLPQVMNILLSGLFSWLPKEIVAVIGLSITLSVVVFIIKLIRG